MMCHFKVGNVFESLKLDINPIQADVFRGFQAYTEKEHWHDNGLKNC